MNGAQLPSQPDETLLAEYAAGAIEAFDELYKRYRQPTFGFLVRLLRDRAIAEDVFQDLWLQVIEQSASFRAGSTVRTWLFTLARSRAYDRMRREAVRRAASAAHASASTATELGNGTGFNPDDPLDAYASHDQTTSAAARAGAAGNEPTDVGSGDPLEARLQTERRQLLERALQALPQEQRVVFLLREEAELSLMEAAQTLGVPYETAKSRYRYALARLREHFSVTVRRAR